MRGLSYLNLFRLYDDSPLRQVVGRQLNFYSVAYPPDRRLLGTPEGVKPQKGVAVCQPNTMRTIRMHRYYYPFNAEGSFAGHVKISGSPPVTKTVCSKWADSEPSCVTAVQPSFNIFTPAWPAFTIGSIANVIPLRNFWLHLEST